MWSNYPLERLNVAPRSALASAVIKRRTNVDRIIPNDAAIVELVGCQRLERKEAWQLERRRFFLKVTIAKIPEPEEALDLADGDPSAQPAASTS